MSTYLMIGAGAFATALAWSLPDDATVVLYTRHAEVAEAITMRHHNPKCFAEVILPARITATTHLQAMTDVDAIFMAIPSATVADFLAMRSLNLLKGTPIINCSKGITPDGRLLRDVYATLCPDHPYGGFFGPGLAADMMRPRTLTHHVLATEHAAVAALAPALVSDRSHGVTGHPWRSVSGGGEECHLAGMRDG